MSEKIQQAIERIDSQSEGQSDAVKIIAQHIIENFIKTDAAAEKLLNEKLRANLSRYAQKLANMTS